MNNYCCFKYRSIDKRLIEQLINSAMYFPHRSQLNDPFDCNVDIVRAVKKAIKEVPFPNAEILRKFLKDESHHHRFAQGIEKMGIGSFSLSNDETLMWSHYGNDHKGVTLRYDFSEGFLNNENKILGVSKVSYNPNSISDWLRDNADLYRYNHQEFITGLLKIVLMSKAPAWKYEQEARIVIPEFGVLNLPRKSLTHVFFGLQTSEQDRNLIYSIINKYFSDVKFGESKRTDNDFGIQVVEI